VESSWSSGPESRRPRFDAIAIYEALDAQRARRGLTWRDVALEMGVRDSSVLTRLRKGGRVHFPFIMTVFAWLGAPASAFVRFTER
jgi:hypothetical protein